MKEIKYQKNYSLLHDGRVLNEEKRFRKAEQIILIINHYVSKRMKNSSCNDFSVLDIGCSSGMIDFKLADHYKKAFVSKNIEFQELKSNIYSSYHLFVIRIKNIKSLNEKRRFFNKILSKGINVNLHYIPIYLQPFYRKLGFKEGYCIEAEKYYLEAMTLPLYYELKSMELEFITETICKSIASSIS